MIENQNEVSRNLEKALQALEQAKQRVANEKKKQNEKKRKAENHHKYIMGGIIVKYFPDCYQYDEDELKRFIRFRSLGEDFTEENLKKVIAGEKESPEKNEKVPERKEAKPEKRKFDLVVDIQEKWHRERTEDMSSGVRSRDHIQVAVHRAFHHGLAGFAAAVQHVLHVVHSLLGRAGTEISE